MIKTLQFQLAAGDGSIKLFERKSLGSVSGIEFSCKLETLLADLNEQAKNRMKLLLIG